MEKQMGVELRNMAFACISLGLVLVTSCSKKNPLETNLVSPEICNEFSSKIINLKKSAQSAEQFQLEYDQIYSSYGSTAFPIASESNLPQNPLPYAKAAGAPSSKVAAQSELNVEIEPVGVKSTKTMIRRPFFYNLKPKYPFVSWDVDVSVISSQTWVDPFLVVYDVTNGDFSNSRLIQNLKVLGYNDDAGGTLNSKLTSVNCMSLPDVVILAFAVNSPGSATLKIDIKLRNQQGNVMFTYTETYNIALAGKALWGDESGYLLDDGQRVSQIPSGWAPYVGNGATFITDNLEWGATDWGGATPYSDGDSYLWAFNFSEMKGTANDDYFGLGSACYLDPYKNGSFPRGGWHYPNVVLMGGYSDGGTMRMIQMVGYKH